MISFLAELCHRKFYNLFCSQCKIFIVSKTDQLKLYKTGSDQTRSDPNKKFKAGKSLMSIWCFILRFGIFGSSKILVHIFERYMKNKHWGLCFSKTSLPSWFWSVRPPSLEICFEIPFEISPLILTSDFYQILTLTQEAIFLDAQASLGSMLESQWVSDSRYWDFVKS